MTIATVTQLFRHPVKSLTPESVAAVELTHDGRIIGDRVLGFRFRGAADRTDWSWITKSNFVGLVNTPALARLSCSFDLKTMALSLYVDDLKIVEANIRDESQRAEAERAFSDYVSTLPENPLTDYPERSPAALVGDGEQPLFHDSAAGLVTLHSEESAAALGSRLDAGDFDGRRFRSNIVISGLSEPFEELSWVGRRLKVGETEFEVTKPVKRCLVTHANPVTGTRDLDVMGALVSEFTPSEPQFAVMLQVISGSGVIRQGDTVELLA